MKGQAPGAGPLTSAILVAHLPELGQRDGKALTTLVGLAPRFRDSGQQRGNRAIRGGRGLVRQRSCRGGHAQSAVAAECSVPSGNALGTASRVE